MSDQKSWTRSAVAGGLVGLFSGGLVVLLLEYVGHNFLGTADPGDLGAITTAMAAWVLGAEVMGSAVAGGMATYWHRLKSNWRLSYSDSWPMVSYRTTSTANGMYT